MTMFFRLFLLLFLLFTTYVQAQTLEKISLQLQWKYQFQFAGFLVAKERGYYRDVGLDVDILEYNNTNSMQDLIDDKIDFALNNSIIVYKNKRLQDVTLLATYFQRSPLVIIAQPEIKTPLDLIEKTIMISENNLYNSSLSILLEYFSIDEKNTHFIPPSFNIEDFISKKVDAITAFKSNEVFELDKRDINYTLIDPVEYGFSTNAINLFCSHNKIANNPQQVENFLSATKKGWQYALEHIDETAMMIHTKYQPNKSFELLQYEGQITKELMLLDIYDIGELNEDFIAKTYKQLLRSKRVDANQTTTKLFYKTSKKPISKGLNLSEKEKEWISKHPVISYSEVNWKPLSIIENKKMNGIMGDYLDLVSKRTGITFKYIRADSWPDVLEKFKNNEIDIVPGIGSSPQETKLGLVSNAYASYPMAIVTGDEYNFLDSLKDIQDKTIAVPKYYTSYNFIQQNYPNTKIIATDSIEEALLLVASKEADAFVGHLATSLYYLTQLNLSDLKISGTTSFEFEHHYLIQNRYPELLTIINKAFASISEQEKNAIKANWVHTKVEHRIDTTLILEILGATLLIIIFIIYRQFTLQKYNIKLKELKERMELALMSSDSGVWDWNLIDNTIYLSAQWKMMLGYTDAELPNLLSSWKEHVHPEDLEKVMLDLPTENSYRLRKKDNSYIWVLSKSTTEYDINQKPIRKIGIHTNITERKIAQDKLFEQKLMLHHQAHHDALTGLPNRILFNDRLSQAIENAKRGTNKLALFFIDLDHFKEINDSLGHDAGDKVLKEVTTRLETTIRKKDTLARLGGDEFTIIVDDLNNSQNASILAQKILKVLTEPIVINEQMLYVSSSIGISLYPDDGKTSEDLLKYSDAAMYKAKNEGRNNFQFYSSDMTELAFERVLMETSLREALKKDEFIVYYQPQVDGKTNTIIGMEALVRWQHPSLGLISPAKFIPLAESTGLIVEIDRFVMKKAMNQVAQWHKNGLNPGVLALNLAMKQLQQKDFIATLSKIIASSKIETQYLELEVTESQIMINPESAIETLKKISDMGIELAVDDFGTGYSSLSYLKKLPINKLKIDQSFVIDLPNDDEDVAITKAIIALAKSLNLKIIAEGVETFEQKEFLVKSGCQYIQGYFFYKPMSAEDLETILKQSSNKNMTN